MAKAQGGYSGDLKESDEYPALTERASGPGMPET